MSEIKPFRLDIPQAELDDLKQRLTNVRWPSQLPGIGWSRGTDLGYLQELTSYWRDSYDWRAWEKRLNTYPQYTTEIDGTNIHFLHVRSPHENAFPLILSHGWPGSIVEFIDLIEPLTNPEDPADAFHVVIPSLPNFGLSGPVNEAGWDSHRIAKAFAELMSRLGYTRYGAQGGDFGAFIAPDLGRVDSEHVAGVHVNAATAGFIPFGGVTEEQEASFTEREKENLARMNKFLAEGNGYFQIQASRPQTIGYSFADSPVGLLSWFIEKFKEWTHAGDLPEDAIDRDHILTNVMLYWLTNTGASSAHMYYESMHTSNWPTPSTVPTAVANFAEDIAIRQFAEPLNNIVRWTEYDRGGHFAALEAGDLLLADVREFFRTIR